MVLKTKIKHQNRNSNKDKSKEKQEVLKNKKQDITKINTVCLLKKLGVKRNENIMYKAKKQKGIETKTWWLLLETVYFRLQKKKHKNKNNLILVFIEFIYQKFLKIYLFFLKNLCFFSTNYNKKTTKTLIKNMIKNLLPNETKRELKTC